MAFTAEWLLEDFNRDENFADGAKKVKTNFVPLGINFFHPSGLSASLKGTFVNQDGKFERQGSLGSFEDSHDNFWLFDAAIKYRFPKRYGFVTVGVTNLFDEHFEYFDTDRKIPVYNLTDLYLLQLRWHFRKFRKVGILKGGEFFKDLR